MKQVLPLIQAQFIEYKRLNFSWFPWKTVDKTFKTKPKAEEYIRKHFSR